MFPAMNTSNGIDQRTAALPGCTKHGSGEISLTSQISALRCELGAERFRHRQARKKLLAARHENQELRKSVRWYQTLVKRLDKNREQAELLKNENMRLRKQSEEHDSIRVQELERKIEDLEGQISLLRKHRFGRTSEQSSLNQKMRDGKSEKRKRGQRKGAKGHGRQSHENLPVEEEIREMNADQIKCSVCGKERVVLGDTEDSQQIEIEVRAHRRTIKRRKYRSACKCPGQPKIVTAQTAPKLIPRGAYGTSVWTAALLDKYLFQRPTNRFIEAMRTHGIMFPQGTLTGGFKRLTPLFVPVMDGIVEESRRETHWHVDETSWQVFEEIEGKRSQRWWLWVFRGSRTAVFKLDPTRSATVPREHFGDAANGIISSDRFRSYKAMTRDGRFVNAFCWAHVRRDFIEMLPWPRAKTWALNWIDRIAYLYRLNNQRLAALAVSHIAAFNSSQEALRTAIYKFGAHLTIQLMCDAFDERQLKVLAGIERDWHALTVFLDYPEVPMDNNQAEREIRGMVVGRKCYYGSGAVWSGELAAMIYSITRTLLIWGINPQSWMMEYLDACAANNGRIPNDVSLFLPWNMPDRIKQRLAHPSRRTALDTG